MLGLRMTIPFVGTFWKPETNILKEHRSSSINIEEHTQQMVVILYRK